MLRTFPVRPHPNPDPARSPCRERLGRRCAGGSVPPTGDRELYASCRSERDWRLVRDRLRRAWEHGEITRPVRLVVESLERVLGASGSSAPRITHDRGISSIAVRTSDRATMPSTSHCSTSNSLASAKARFDHPSSVQVICFVSIAFGDVVVRIVITARPAMPRYHRHSMRSCADSAAWVQGSCPQHEAAVACSC